MKARETKLIRNDNKRLQIVSNIHSLQITKTEAKVKEGRESARGGGKEGKGGGGERDKKRNRTLIFFKKKKIRGIYLPFLMN